jgi:hypothetical protein
MLPGYCKPFRLRLRICTPIIVDPNLLTSDQFWWLHRWAVLMLFKCNEKWKTGSNLETETDKPFFTADFNLKNFIPFSYTEGQVRQSNSIEVAVTYFRERNFTGDCCLDDSDRIIYIYREVLVGTEIVNENQVKKKMVQRCIQTSGWGCCSPDLDTRTDPKRTE